MLSIRSIARSAPRTASRLTLNTARYQLSGLRKPALWQASWRQPTTTRLAASFSTSPSRREDSVTDELVAKLENEISLEKDMRDEEEYSPNIKDYLATSPYEIHDAPGQEEVVLTRKYNDEDIRIAFTIDDLNQMSDSNAENSSEEELDRAMFDENEPAPLESAQSGGANTKGSINKGRTSGGNVKVAPEDSISPADRPELGEEFPESDIPENPSFPAKLNIRISKGSAKKGALNIEAFAQDGEIVIENVYYFPESDLADPKTADHDWKRRIIYAGPPFGNLDEDLQMLLERFLEERGVDTKLALFVPDYIDFKEQKEYVRWLENMQSFFRE